MRHPRSAPGAGPPAAAGSGSGGGNGSEGELVLRVESGDERVAATTWNAILHVSAGWDPYALVDQGESEL
jgi:hypothetical protein